jgi:elongation factor G
MEKSAAPWPLLQIAIEPKSKADQERLLIALSKLVDEDPWFHVKSDQESGQIIIAFVSELDLNIIVDRMRREFKVEVNVGAPQVAYRETITRRHEQDYTHKKQTGGTGQFARVKIVFEPNPESSEFEFETKVVGGAVPKEYIPGVEKGINSVMISGPFAGFPMIGVKATLVDGVYHDVDSSVLAFEIAGRACFREAASRLGVQLLEPIMKVEVVTPEDYVGNVIGELNGRRGQIRGQETRGMAVVVNAMVPLANMFKLEDTLRSRSKGQALLSASYAGYSPVPLPDDRDPPPAMAIRA